MNKVEKSIILPSEGNGWDIWVEKAGNISFVRSLDGAITRSEAKANTLVAFSASRVATFPIMVPSSEASLCHDTCQLELENVGLLIDPENRHCWDYINVEKNDQTSFVSAIYLIEEELNPENDLRHCKFDYSARFYLPSIDGDSIALWKERNIWCMALYRNKIPFLTQPLGAELLDLENTIEVIIDQLSIKGISFHPHELFIWSEDESTITPDLTSLNILVTKEQKPSPSVPKASIDIKPTEVLEWEGKMVVRKRVQLALCALMIVYAGIAGYFWWKIYVLDQEIAQHKSVITQFEPLWESNQNHFNDWAELEPVRTANWPFRVYKECVMSIPSGQPIRFSEINILNDSIQIRGNAVNTNKLNIFKAKLLKSPVFQEFKWNQPQPTKSQKTGRWEFRYNAETQDFTQ